MVLAQGSAHMAAALAGYRRRALVSTAGWTISHLVQHEVPAHGSCPGWLAIEEPWSALAGPFLALLAQMG